MVEVGIILSEAFPQAVTKGTSKVTSEIIRRAIDREVEHAHSLISQHDHHGIWEDILRFVENRKKLGITGQPYHWNRQELYEDPD
jgi:hypothetical protein